MIDLFGHDVAVPVIRNGRQPTKCKGYAMTPGTGPAGETCKTCRHLARIRYSKTYLKCALIQAGWTHGPGTDVKARAPACGKWEAAE